MAKYCPKCYTGVGPDDAVCGNCGNVLKENTSGVEDFTAGVFDNENLSHDISGKEIPVKPRMKKSYLTKLSRMKSLLMVLLRKKSSSRKLSQPLQNLLRRKPNISLRPNVRLLLIIPKFR